MTEREAAAASARPLRDALNDAFEQRVQRLLANQDELRKFIRAAEQNADDFISLNRAYSELRAASAPQAVRRPLTEEQIDALYEANCESRNPYAPSRKFFGRTVRAAEFAHGIVPLAPQDGENAT